MSYRQRFAAILGEKWAKHVTNGERGICRAMSQRETPKYDDLDLLKRIINTVLDEEGEARLAAIAQDNTDDQKVQYLIDTYSVDELRKIAYGTLESRNPASDTGNISTSAAVNNAARSDYWTLQGRYAEVALKKLGK